VREKTMKTAAINKVKLVVTGSQGRSPYYYCGDWASNIVGLNEVCEDFHQFASIYRLLEASTSVETSGHHYVGNGIGCKLGIILPSNFFIKKKGEMFVDEKISIPLKIGIEQAIKQILRKDVEVELFCPNIR
jgi:hypothetical protein